MSSFEHRKRFARKWLDDPDLAELMDDNPATLPDKLKHKGWGRQTMQEALDAGTGGLKSPAAPGTEQPIFDERCVQCGHPITKRAGSWEDHAGHKFCNNVFLDEPIWVGHASQDDLLLEQRRRKDWGEFSAKFDRAITQRLLDPQIKIQVGQTTCNKTITRSKRDHACTCVHPTNHFGFHECVNKECRHLWR